MIVGLLVLLLVCLNLGGLTTVILQFGRGEVLSGLGSLAIVLVLNITGFWLVRQLREDT